MTMMHTFEDFEYIRNLYNTSRGDLEMESPLPEQSVAGQFDWWRKSGVMLYVARVRDERVGFVALTPRWSLNARFHTPILAVDPAHRGKGYGRQFIEAYIRLAGGPLAGAQRTDNPVICRLNAQMGWQIVGERDGVQYLFHPGPRLTDNAREAHLYAQRRARG